MDIEVLKSYLVDLGFKVNQPQLRKFDQALKQAAGLVENHTAGFIKDILKWQGAIIGAFTGISGGVLALGEHVAEADQQYRLFGLRMFLTTEQARKLQIGMKELGASMAEIAWDPELNARFLELSQLQDRLASQLGANFEQDMRSIRDLRFEFTKLKVTLEYLSFKFVSTLFEQMGGDAATAQQKLAQLREWLVDQLPQAAEKLAKFFKPILKDTWEILKDLGGALQTVATVFTNLMGVLSLDSSLMGTEASFEKFGKSVLKVADFLADFTNYVTSAVDEVIHLVNAILLLFGLRFQEAGSEFKKALGPAPKTMEERRAEESKAKDSVPTQALRGPIFDQVRSVAEAQGVDPKLAQAVAQQESGGRQYNRDGSLVSSGKALGVMQLTPATARDLRVDPTNAAENIQGGVRYLHQLLARYQNDLPKALAAYNMGPNALDRAIQRHSALPQETLNYVRNIERNLGQDVSIGDVQIQIMQPNASPEEVYRQAKRGMTDALRGQARRHVAQFGYAGS